MKYEYMLNVKTWRLIGLRYFFFFVNRFTIFMVALETNYYIRNNMNPANKKLTKYS